MKRNKRIVVPLLIAALILGISGAAYAAADENGAHAEIARIIAAKLPAERVAVYAVTLNGDRPIVAINEDVLMPPASCAKIITAAAALTELGIDYRFRTAFSSDAKPNAGSIDTLYIRGNGDPHITPEAMWGMAKAVADHGIVSIRGDVVIDDGFFASYDYPGLADGGSLAYEAPTGAVAANFNVVEFIIAPGGRIGEPAHVSANPSAPYVEVVNRIRTGTRTHISASRTIDDGREVFTLTGEARLGSALTTVARSIGRPASLAGSLFAKLLVQHGVKLAGTVKSGPIPPRAVHLFDEPSMPLALVVRDMNKYSSNFIAEQITKHLGSLRSGKPGTTEHGLMATREWLSSVGIEPHAYVLENGSGLSYKTMFTARQLVRVLTAASRDPAIAPDFMSSLAILGVDGTMQTWQAALSIRGTLRAKTGTLKGVACLAGYVPGRRGGHMAAFAIMAQGLKTGIGDARAAEAEIAQALSNFVEKSAKLSDNAAP